MRQCMLYLPNADSKSAISVLTNIDICFICSCFRVFFIWANNLNVIKKNNIWLFTYMQLSYLGGTFNFGEMVQYQLWWFPCLSCHTENGLPWYSWNISHSLHPSFGWESRISQSVFHRPLVHWEVSWKKWVMFIYAIILV